MKTLSCMALAVFLLSMAGIAMAVDINIGPEEITLQTEAARKPATFPHRQHQETIGCMTCHHTDGEIMMVDTCENCHNKDMDDKKLDSFKDVGHALCKDCHKQAKREEGKDAPIRCSGCHVRK